MKSAETKLRFPAMAALCALTILSLSSCASIMHAGGQEVRTSSTPTSVEVWVDGAKRGATPLITKLPRRASLS